MSESREIDLRLDLARGHWSLGDRDDAILCLERCAENNSAELRLRSLAESFLNDVRSESGDQLLARRLEDLLSRLAPAPAADSDVDTDEDPVGGSHVSSATLAELLAEQGHRERALAVVDDVLRRDPADQRALAMKRNLASSEPNPTDGVVEELERWLANAKRRLGELEARS